MLKFVWGLRVYYEDTDLGGIVYYANHLRYMERARTEWLRDIGCEQDVLLADAGAIFVVVKAGLDYKSPARFNDVLLVTVEIVSMGRASVVVRQNVHRGAPSAPVGAIGANWQQHLAGPVDKPLTHHVCEGEIRIACVNASTLYPCPIPDSIYTELTRER